MPEYVYALHDFTPEHEDEIEFHAGERIEVVEKDDLYGDGWWQGRNLVGKVGLFPQGYTAPAPSESLPPSTSSSTTELAPQDFDPKPPLQALDEESEGETSTPNNIAAPVPHTPAILLNGNDTDTEIESPVVHQRTISSGEEVMKATLTDVQKAIEQLGRGRGANGDGDERSFSFASSRGDHTEGDTDTDDYDLSDLEGPSGGGESWHKGARTKLAEKARRAVAEAEKLEAMMGNSGSMDRRAMGPPIEVELSDESEGEDDYTSHSSNFPREHPHIPEEDEDVVSDPASPPAQHGKDLSSGSNTVKRSSSGANSAQLVAPVRDEYEAQTATATRTTFPVFQPPVVPPTPETSNVTEEPNVARSFNSTLLNEHEPAAAVDFPEAKGNSNHAVYRESLIALPSPTGSSPGMTGGTPLPVDSKHSSVTSGRSISTRPSGSGLSQPPMTASSAQNTLVEDQPKDKKDKTHPSEWTVGEVVDWLQSKGFDQDVCEKFTEQEITGDVLLELDVNLLKTEIGIMAFGKRMRIANAITDLRRPPSVIYSDHADQRSPSFAPHSPLSAAQSNTHSRHVSQSHSHHSFPGAGHAYSQSVQGSLGSPMAYGTNGAAYAIGGMVESPGMEYLGLPDRSPMILEQDAPGMGKSMSVPAMNGNGKASKGRPSQLSLSPSDGALKQTAMAVSDVPEADEEDRGVASEGEIVPTTTMRRRLFGRSHDSSSSKMGSSANSRHSKEGLIMASPTFPDKSKIKEKDKDKDHDKDSASSRHARSKKSLDVGKGSGERLSIFGGTFTGTLGKGRKPAPKYSATNEEPIAERASMFTLPRLHSHSSRKISSSTSSSNAGTPKQAYKEPKPMPVAVVKETRDPALLRKRTSSAPAPPTDATRNTHANGLASPLKQGQSILEQIGESDHTGWMKKKGDRYNSWKTRFFVLKGPHLYCLRSSSNSETKIKGYVNIVGYRVTVDENVNPGKYGFRIEHDNDKTHYFSSDEKIIIRDWMKAIMKATINRDYTRPVISSCNIPTIPLMVAQAMNPAPRPPSPGARDATQRALRRENPNQLSSRDARILMGLPSAGGDSKEERTRLESFFSNEAVSSNNNTPMLAPHKSPAPARPSREMRRLSSARSPVISTPEENAVIEWANTHLPMSLQIMDPTGSLCGGLALLRIAESIKGRPTSPPVHDSAFPQSPTDDKLDGLFQLFDFLLDNDVKMGSVSINDIRQGKRDKVLQLLRALKGWEDKRRMLANSIGGASSVQSGGFMAPVSMVW